MSPPPHPPSCLLSVKCPHVLFVLPPLHWGNVFVCVCGVTQLHCTIPVIHLFICHRCYHGYYRLTAVFSLRRTQVRCGRGDRVRARLRMRGSFRGGGALVSFPRDGFLDVDQTIMGCWQCLSDRHSGHVLCYKYRLFQVADFLVYNIVFFVCFFLQQLFWFRYS